MWQHYAELKERELYVVFLHGLKCTCSRWRRHFVDVSRKAQFILVRFKYVQIFQVSLSEFLRVNVVEGLCSAAVCPQTGACLPWRQQPPTFFPVCSQPVVAGLTSCLVFMHMTHTERNVCHAFVLMIITQKMRQTCQIWTVRRQVPSQMRRFRKFPLSD